MKRKTETDERIAAVLNQAEAGVPRAGLIRFMLISEQSFYRSKKQ
jgi:hypothetical protein